jgi:hypothetical protein
MHGGSLRSPITPGGNDQLRNRNCPLARHDGGLGGCRHPRQVNTLVKAFTANIITPLVNAAGGGGTNGLGVHVKGPLINFGAFVSAVIYFISSCP